VFLDFIAGVISHQNSYTGVEYRHDPTIIGWEIAARPRDPGNPDSGALQGWVNQMAGYMRLKAPHQLIMVGFEGFFGSSSPHHLRHNPHTDVSGFEGFRI
jgi:mannan endo-1,4-beta-mannosidase